MSASDSRKDDFRGAIERLCDEYQDVLVSNDGDIKMHMPVLGHWLLITTHDDCQDPTLLASSRLCRKNQATHETAGLLYLNLQELQRPWEPD